jgi:hypothetical protein
MDSQVARLVLTADSEELAGTQIDALGAYNERSRQVDTNLQRSLTTSSSDADRAIVLDLLFQLALYRQRAWQALTADDAANGYYTQATNVMHLNLLPAADELRESSETRLDRTYDQKRAIELWAGTLAVLLGLVLVGLLGHAQLWMRRRFRRLINPALLASTLLTTTAIVLVVASLADESARMADARIDDLNPFLTISKARAISHDAAADTSRFLISDNLDYYHEEFDRKSRCLSEGDSCDRAEDAEPLSGEAAERWSAYDEAHQTIVELAQSGDRAEAIEILTGIRRGDAEFDFSYFDATIAATASDHEQAFDRQFDDTEILFARLLLIPCVLLALVIVLVPLGVRSRLAEYR